jgi:hypothetical protein
MRFGTTALDDPRRMELLAMKGAMIGGLLHASE